MCITPARMELGVASRPESEVMDSAFPVSRQVPMVTLSLSRPSKKAECSPLPSGNALSHSPVTLLSHCPQSVSSITALSHAPQSRPSGTLLSHSPQSRPSVTLLSQCPQSQPSITTLLSHGPQSLLSSVSVLSQCPQSQPSVSVLSLRPQAPPSG